MGWDSGRRVPSSKSLDLSEPRLPHLHDGSAEHILSMDSADYVRECDFDPMNDYGVGYKGLRNHLSR